MLCQTYTATLLGMEGLVTEVEVMPSGALPGIQLTGLPGNIIKESKDRISACLSHLGYEVPKTRLIIHLIPASIKKQGSHFDLPIAMSILGAENIISKEKLKRCAFIGELSMDGRVHATKGSLALAEVLEKMEAIDHILVAEGAQWELGFLDLNKTRLVKNISEAISFVRDGIALPPVPKDEVQLQSKNISFPLDKIIGQNTAKRALQISIAGRHPLLMVGSPGVGKTLLAQASPSLSPPPDPQLLKDLIKIYGAGMRAWEPEIPFRAPHHSVSRAGLLGGGTEVILPGEASFAHGGILFLDELGEFRKDAIEGLREPLEEGSVHLRRIGQSVIFPARFLLIAAMNPCPCGFALSPGRVCICSPREIHQYKKNLSGPILDRIDLCALMAAPNQNIKTPENLLFANLKKNISHALSAQKNRYSNSGYKNGDATLEANDPILKIQTEASHWLNEKGEKESLSYRALARLSRVARTIADLEQSPEVQLCHLQEAWGLRCPNLTGHFGRY